MLGIQPIIARLHSLGIAQLSKSVYIHLLLYLNYFNFLFRHIEIFEFVRIEDEKEFAARLRIVSILYMYCCYGNQS